MNSAPFYTEQVLSENFMMIANGFQSVDKALSHLEGHLAELSRKPVEVVIKKMPKSRKALPFALGVAVGIVVYKNQQTIKALAKKASENVKEQATKASAFPNGDATPSENGPDPDADSTSTI
jgi:hypothetical protein